MKLTLKHTLAIIILVLSFAAPAWPQTNIMQFAAYPPDPMFEKFMGDHAWRIFATGEIDAAAGKRLAALIAEKNIPFVSRLYLHSPGGSLAGGMALGRMIREHKLSTFVGQLDTALPYAGGKPGYCYSACATAFLGGDFRYWTNGSVYGVHRFFWNKQTDKDAEMAQIMSAAVVEYIRSMDVDTKIFALASQAGPSEVVTPSHETLLALNVVNDGRKPVKWTIESLSQADVKEIYLKGEQETENGINKFMIACPAGAPMYLYAIFDAGSNAEEDMRWPVNWIFIDGQSARMDKQLFSKTADHGKISLFYYLSPDLLTAIAKAKTVGVGLQPSTASPIFAGFNSMPFEGGAAKLSGLLGVCHQGSK